VLKAMRRGYTVERYLQRIDALRCAAPDIELHSDFIVGYPGETAIDFDATVALMQRVRFAQSYLFKYSPRPGTLAAELPDDVAEVEKERRNQVLLDLQEQHSLACNQALLGTTQQVLVEGGSPRHAERWMGRTVHHRIVHFTALDTDLAGRYVPVRIQEALSHSLVGLQLPEHAAEQPERRQAV
jgi:tRNA-2-methylthio-N6-dimethylallyladenosine synthase